MTNLLIKNDMQWWKEIVMRHSLDHAVLVLFYGLPHKTLEWSDLEVQQLVTEVGERKVDFFDSCLRQVFGSHLNSAENDLPIQSLALLKRINHNLSPALNVEFDQFYHVWTIGATCRRPEKMEPFIRWVLDHSAEDVQQQALMWLIENSDDTPAHTMYWRLLEERVWNENLEIFPWGRPGCACTWNDIIKTDDIANQHGEQILQSWRQKQLLLECVEGDGGERDKRRI